MGHVTDPTDPRLGRGVDTEPVEQHEVYLVLSEDEKSKGFIRPVRKSYKHEKCGCVTNMSLSIAETYARDPKFYGATYCVGCGMHLPVGPEGEFLWIERDGTVGAKVGT